MKAMVLEEFGTPLRLEEIETPAPGPDEALVQVVACGIDGTDLKLLDGFGYTPELPFIMGHEPAGVVAAVGDRVADFRPGDRVITYNFLTCGRCPFCLTHREQLCSNLAGIVGVRGRHGGYGEYFTVPARQLVAVPGQVHWLDAATCCDAGITAYHAVGRSRLRLGETIVVLGIGGVGSVITQLATAAGARALAVDRLDVKLERARRMGADVAFNANEVDIAAAVRELTDGLGADCVIDVVGSEETLTRGVAALRHGGRLVVVGYTPELYKLSGKWVAQNELEIIGSRCGRKQDLIDTLGLFAQGRIRSIVTDLYPLEEANEALAALRAGQVLGRAVLLTLAGQQIATEDWQSE